MYGYLTKYGYMGRMPDKQWRFFATEKEYEEAYEDASNRILNEYGLI